MLHQMDLDLVSVASFMFLGLCSTDSVTLCMISSSMGSSCHWSPGGSNRYRRKITQNKSLIILAKLKGGQQFVRFMITVGAVFKHSLNSCMCYASAKCLLPHQKSLDNI